MRHDFIPKTRELRKGEWIHAGIRPKAWPWTDGRVGQTEGMQC